MNLPRWQHGLLSLLILIALIVLVSMACIRPAISHYNERKEELLSQQTRLQKYRATAAQKNTLVPLYKQQLGKVGGQQDFLPLMASSLAAAKLQEQIKSLIEKHQGQLVSTQPVQAQADDLFTPAMIRVHMKSDIKGLSSVLYELDSEQPLVYIDNLQIQRVGPRRKSSQQKNIANIKPLNTRFDLRVYMLNKQAE